MDDSRHLEQLSRSQALGLLSSVPIGRLVFTHQALPAVRPVNHLVEGESIVVRTTSGATITTVAGRSGTVVAYEADAIDVDTQLGWSVIVVGTARLLDDAAAARRYRSMLTPWLAGPMDDVIVIAADLVTGYRMVPGEPAATVPSGHGMPSGQGIRS